MTPEGEATRKALRWISERRSADPGLRLQALIDEAGRKFDLTPLEQEALVTWLLRKPEAPEA